MPPIRAILVVAASCLVVGACSSGHVVKDRNPSAHRAAVEELLGHPVADWDKYEAAMVAACKASGESFALEVTMAADASGLPAFRTSINYVCPWRAGAIDEAMADSASAGAVCTIPKSARTTKQAEIGEALDC